VDRIARTISFAPIRSPLRIPLTAFADWPNEQIPWAEIAVGKEGTAVKVEPPGLLPDLQVRMRRAD
jgi:hypothetical protein